MTLEVLKFSAEWCGPCRALDVELEKCLTKFSLIHVDVDRDTGATKLYGIRGVPTLVVRQEGKEVGRLTGRLTAAEIDKLLASMSGSEDEMTEASAQ